MSDQVRQEKKQNKTGKPRGRPSITTGIFLIPVIAVLFPTCIVLAAGMAPSLVAYVVDRTKGKYLTITVALLNFCGTLPGLAMLWQRGQSYDAALRIVADPIHWLASYGAAAGGWLIFLCVPPVLSLFYSSISTTRVDLLRRKQMTLIEIWGPEVVPGDLPEPPE